MRKTWIVSIVFLSACHSTASAETTTFLNRKITPGAINIRITQSNIHKTICIPGYTKTVRAPVNYTEKLKRQGLIQYHFTGKIKDYEEDHLIPLELGGSNSPKNLWPQPHSQSFRKDALENNLHSKVCSGALSLTSAQNKIIVGW